MLAFESHFYQNNGDGNLAMDIRLGGSSCPLFPDQVRTWNVGFCRGSKTKGPSEKPSEQG